MGDLVPATEKPKEGGSPSSSIQCPMFNSTNYTVWIVWMRVCLKVHKVWETIETGSTDEEKNIIAMALLFQSIPESLVLTVGELSTAKQVWEAIRTRYVGAERFKEARLQTLMAEFDRLQMKDTETIDEFSGKLSEISSKSAALGVNVEESKLVKKFLKSLPRKKYIHIVASLEQVLDLNVTSFEDIVGRLKAYEERISEEEETQEDANKMISATTPQIVPTGYSNYKKAQESNNSETQSADELLMHEVVYLNEKNCTPSEYETNSGEDDLWYLDNGVSNHTTGDQRYFSDIDETMTGKVHFDDDSRIDIKGKRSISFTDMNGEPRKMTDVYFIPDLKRKHARKVFPQATSYRASKALELVHGDLCGPITQTTLARNRYIFVLIDDFTRYMWTILLKEKGDAFSKFKRFKSLVETEAGENIQTFRMDRGGEFTSSEFNSFCDASGIKRHLTAPYTPQQNGVVERQNMTLMGMARSIMKDMRLPNYLWG
ncbi:uncharacterized protein LOC112084488 [Eutrema salsugineum]|uniref:uncharacterized protein LOC112084488 n=1 Tax=Eutrema salsugineum TaxID=72664 RepID=UPI000CECFD8A|nr:uncharacterized protein LOC112084488 [Eutrema salsugineum]